MEDLLSEIQRKTKEIDDVIGNPRKYRIETLLRELGSEWHSEIDTGRKELEKLAILCRSKVAKLGTMKEGTSMRLEEGKNRAAKKIEELRETIGDIKIDAEASALIAERVKVAYDWVEETKRWSKLGFDLAELGYRLIYASIAELYNTSRYKLAQAKLIAVIFRSLVFVAALAVYFIFYFIAGPITDLATAMTRSAYALIPTLLMFFFLEYFVGEKLDDAKTRALIPCLVTLFLGLVSQKHLNLAIRLTIKDLDASPI